VAAHETVELPRDVVEIRTPGKDGDAEQVDDAEILQPNFAGGEGSSRFQRLEVMGNN
jgi:hypothetical protein